MSLVFTLSTLRDSNDYNTLQLKLLHSLLCLILYKYYSLNVSVNLSTLGLVLHVLEQVLCQS